MSALDKVRETWTELGERDAFWAVLTGESGAARQWQLEDFFRSGSDEIATLMQQLPSDLRKEAALDFGCGAGRLTRALREHFDRAVGIDIAPTMIERARALTPSAEFVCNDRDDLSVFASRTFDLVYSNITLQHMPPELSARYIAEFFRVSRGMVVFQIPAEFIAKPRPRTELRAPLPRSAFRAEITVQSKGLQCAPGAHFPIVLRVRNASNTHWPSRGADGAAFSIRVGNHWRHRFLAWMKQFDDVRAELQHDLGPGEETEVGLWLTAPSKPGRYLLEFDLVQEHVGWFEQRGTDPVSIPVDVDASLPDGTCLGLPPRMEMHGIPRKEVEALIARSGGEVVRVIEDDAPGADWTSYRYFARVLSV